MTVHFPPEIRPDRYDTLARRFGAAVIDIWPALPFMVALILLPDEAHPISHVSIMGAAPAVLTAYYVILHARTGQTVGKRLCGVRVVHAVSEQAIGWKRALLRESPWILFWLALWPVAWTALGASDHETSLVILYENTVLDRLQTLWTLGDAAATLGNARRRSIHDYIGGTVVIRVR